MNDGSMGNRSTVSDLSAVRLPHPSGLWIYLRAWGSLFRTRTWGVADVAAYSDEGGFLRLRELGVDERFDPAPEAEVRAAIDARLVELGAEPVPDGEWADGCTGPGGYGADRQPFVSARLVQEDVVHSLARCKHGNAHPCGLCAAEFAPKCKHGRPWYCGECGSIEGGNGSSRLVDRSLFGAGIQAQDDVPEDSSW